MRSGGFKWTEPGPCGAAGVRSLEAADLCLWKSNRGALILASEQPVGGQRPPWLWKLHVTWARVHRRPLMHANKVWSALGAIKHSAARPDAFYIPSFPTILHFHFILQPLIRGPKNKDEENTEERYLEALSREWLTAGLFCCCTLSTACDWQYRLQVLADKAHSSQISQSTRLLLLPSYPPLTLFSIHFSLLVR